jgi:(E)-4-hydroxy-3-methylbut-2-enyl-diphosphate synthase
VSAAGNPVRETEIAKQILVALGLAERISPELIVCPTCARAGIDVTKLAGRVGKALRNIDRPLRVAVMGCIVNGPGEAADADLAICAAKGKGYIYRWGRRISVMPEAEIVRAMLKELEKI